MHKRNEVFDQNRNLPSDSDSDSEAEFNNMANPQEIALLMQTIQQQQADIVQLQQQLNQFLLQRGENQANPQQNGEQANRQQNEDQINPNGNIFQLSTDQILNHFRHLRPFNGRDDFTLMQFIESVNNAVDLCSNEQLKRYVIKMVLNEKILGEAKRCVQRLGDNLTWEEAQLELKLHFRPRKDYAELINECRNFKVGNLRELFNKVKSVNYQLNELYNFEDEGDKPTIYSPENNDKYLVGIVMEKLDSLVRGNVKKKIIP